MYRSVSRTGRFCGVLLLAVVAVTGVCLANASPPDPTWIAGLWDDADHDDAILAMLAIDGVVVEPVRAAAPTGAVEAPVLDAGAPGPGPHVDVARSRAPPLPPSPA